MYIFRWLTLWTVIGIAIVTPAMFDRDEPGLVRHIMDVRAAQAQEALEPSVTVTESTTLPPTPTPTESAADSPSPTITAEDAPTELSTVEPSPEPILTETPAPAVTTEADTPTSTPTTTPSPTPTVVADLPDLAPSLDYIGDSSQATIARSGGRATSNDRRVVIDFPDRATTAELDVRITKLPRDNGYNRPSPNQAFLAIWRFDATADSGSRAVHEFDDDVTISVRFGPDEMAGFDPRTLAFWSFDEETEEWDRIPGLVDAENSALTVRSNHFSVNAATASLIVNSAALLDGKNVNPQSGSAAFSIPLELPPGVGGLTPSLDLSYDSGRLGEMRTYDAGSGWVGVGWNLDVPNIQFSQDAAYTPEQLLRHRAFLSIGAIGGEMMQDPAGTLDTDGYVWRLRDNPYIKIRASCNVINCVNGWSVWDQSGTKYTFGGGTDAATEFRRFYRQSAGPNIGTIRDYRADVNRIEDTRGNSVVFEYEQTRIKDVIDPNTLYVIDSRIEKIKYNSDAVVIDFVAATDQCIVIPPNDPLSCTNMRFDTPRNVAAANGCWPYLAPPVRETQKLSQVNVSVSGAPARRYQFTYEDTARDFLTDTCGHVLKTTGTLRLRDVSERMPDANGVLQTLTTTEFQYANEPHALLGNNNIDQWGYVWPHLTRVENALGGVILFDYEEKGRANGKDRWSRSVVIEERRQFGPNQPDVVTSYSYESAQFSAGPHQFMPRTR